jgi:hypothetical protein
LETFETAFDRKAVVGHQFEIGHGPQGVNAQSMFRCTDEQSLTLLKQPFANHRRWPVYDLGERKIKRLGERRRWPAIFQGAQQKKLLACLF